MKYVVITGISSGIGSYLIKLISAQGYQVIGTYRSIQHIDPLLIRQDNIHLVRMDLSDEASIENAFFEINKITGTHGLYGLINNAGIAVPGPISHLSMTDLKNQFQVNLFGQVKVIQLSFELLKRYGNGARIINISSVSGLFAAPFLGAYASSKYALEGLSDSLRRELKPMNIKVIVIEPGPLKTRIWKKHLDLAEAFKNSPYSTYLDKARETILETERNAQPVEVMEIPVLHALQSENPKRRYLIHKNKMRFLLLTKLLPVPLIDFLVHRNLISRKRKIRPI